MSFEYNTTGIAKDTLQGSRLAAALSLSVPELTAIANGGPARHGVDSFTAVLALNVKGPAEKAARAQQAGQQPKPPTVKDQVVAAAQPAPTDTGLGSLNAGNVMTEQGMAAGGIVAFDEGGEVPRYNGEFDSFIQADPKGPGYGFAFSSPDTFFDMLNPFESEQVKAIRYKRAGIKYTPPPGYDQQGRPVAAETKAAEAKKQQAPVSTTAQQPPAPPADKGQQGQQPPGGLPSANLPAYPSFGPQYRQAATDYETAAGQLETPAAAANRVLASPEYAGLLGPSSTDVTAAFSPLESTIRGAFPQSEAEALAKIQQREAGLGALREEQRKLLGESKEEAEKSASMGKGEALMALASTLVSTPINNPRFQEGIGNFTGMLRTVRKDLDSARKDYRSGIAKLAEAQELQNIGQSEKAEARFMEGQRMLADVQGKVVTAQLASQSSQAQAAISLGGTEAQREAAKLDKKTQLTLSGIASEQQRAGDIFKGAVDIKQSQLLAGARSGIGGGRLENTAIDNARPRIKQHMDAWDADVKRAALKATNNAEYLRQRQLEEARITQQIEAEELQKLLRNGNMSPAAAPSGGGAQPVIDFRTGKPMV
jgi:hypothetical protein